MKIIISILILLCVYIPFADDIEVHYIGQELCPNWEILLWCQNVFHFCWVLDYPIQFYEIDNQEKLISYKSYNQCILWEYESYLELIK